MGEFLLELLFFLLELVAESILEFAAEAIFDLAFRLFAAFVEISEFKNSALAFAVYALLGAATGGLSLLFFPHPILHPSRLHGISLLLSPILTGLGMRQIGLLLRTKNRSVLQIESFWTGFAFALGMALARFCFTK